MGIIETIFREKPARMFVLLMDDRIERKNPTNLAKEIDMTYSYTANTLRKWEKEEFIVMEKRGREQEVSLTKKGYILAQKIRQIINILQENEKDL